MPDLFGDRCYRPDEVAKKLNIHVRSVYRHIGDPLDPLPALRLHKGGPLRIPGPELNRWLDRRRVDPLNE